MSGADPRDEAAAERPAVADATPRGEAPREADATPRGEPPREADATPSAEPPREPDATPRAEAPREPDAMARGYARSRAKTEAIQAQLEPLGPDERPLGIKLATALAGFVALANLVVAAFGGGGESPATGVAFAVLMAAVAAGLWTRRYLIILLFQALLALSIIVSTLSLAFASNLLAVLLALTVIGLCSPVFWLLVRVMARLQVPQE